MDELTILRTFVGCTTILAAALVAVNMNARITVAGFAIFLVASIAWMADGWPENKSSLMIENAILLLINILGVWRCLPRAAKRLYLRFANGSRSHDDTPCYFINF